MLIPRKNLSDLKKPFRILSIFRSGKSEISNNPSPRPTAGHRNDFKGVQLLDYHHGNKTAHRAGNGPDGVPTKFVGTTNATKIVGLVERVSV